MIRPTVLSVPWAKITLLWSVVPIKVVIPLCVFLQVLAVCVSRVRTFWRMPVPLSRQQRPSVLNIVSGPREAVVPLRHISGRLPILRRRTGKLV